MWQKEEGRRAVRRRWRVKNESKKDEKGENGRRKERRNARKKRNEGIKDRKEGMKETKNGKK